MGKAEAVLITEQIATHPAVMAWELLDRTHVPPNAIEVLKPAQRKSAVYRLHGVGPGGRSIVAKRASRGATEHRPYVEILAHLRQPILELFGIIELDGHSWLFLEDAGEVWYDPEQPEHQGLAIQFFGRLHAYRLDDVSWLPDAGPSYFALVLNAGREVMRSAPEHPSLSVEGRSVIQAITEQLDRAEAIWGRIEATCANMPHVLVHGDFVPKNARVRSRADRLELLVFDWETAGLAPPAADLALLPNRASQQREYHAIVRETWPQVSLSDVKRLRSVGELFRLLHAVKWEGRSFEHDWIERSVARLAAYQIGLDLVLRRWEYEA